MPMQNDFRGIKAAIEVEQDAETTLPSDPVGSEAMPRQDVEEEVEVEQDAEMSLPSDPVRSAAILRRDTFPGIGEKIEIEQDLDMGMTSASDYASGEEQDGESDRDEEEHIAHLLEGGEAESATGKQNRKLSRAWCMNLLLEPEDNEGTNTMGLQEDRHQNHCDHSSERDAPVSTRRDLERHTIQTVSELGSHNLADKMLVDNEASVTALGGDGPVHGTCTQSVRQEGVAERLTISGLKDQNRQDTRAQHVRSEQPGDKIDKNEREDERSHPMSTPTPTQTGQVEDISRASRAEVSNATFSTANSELLT
jgi:hypothetical protein